jgi:hypothetical protein
LIHGTTQHSEIKERRVKKIVHLDASRNIENLGLLVGCSVAALFDGHAPEEVQLYRKGEEIHE